MDLKYKTSMSVSWAKTSSDSDFWIAIFFLL